MRFLELRIPPLLLMLCFGVAMWWLSLLVGAAGYAFAPGRYLAILLGSVALGLLAIAVMHFRRAGTTVNPVDPGQATVIVMQGVYRYSRNPMYLGMLLLLAAWGLWLSNLAALALLPAFVCYMNRFQILPEERFMAQKFGDDFRRYRASVRRWC